MRAAKATAFAASLVLSASIAGQPTNEPTPAQPVKLALMCFKSGEQTPPNSMTKICYYNCLGSVVAITISSVSLCPLSIDH